MPWFRNHYRCDRCGHEWSDDWAATCDDDCPHCGARHMSPYKSDDIDPPCSGRPLRSASERQAIDLKIAIAKLKDARDHLKKAGCPSTLRKVRSALKSAEGAGRHMARRLSAGGLQ